MNENNVYGKCYRDEKHRLTIGLYPAILPNCDIPIWFVGSYYGGAKYLSYAYFQPSNIDNPEIAQAEFDAFAEKKD